MPIRASNLSCKEPHLSLLLHLVLLGELILNHLCMARARNIRTRRPARDLLARTAHHKRLKVPFDRRSRRRRADLTRSLARRAHKGLVILALARIRPRRAVGVVVHAAARVSYQPLEERVRRRPIDLDLPEQIKLGGFTRGGECKDLLGRARLLAAESITREG